MLPAPADRSWFDKLTTNGDRLATDGDRLATNGDRLATNGDSGRVDKRQRIHLAFNSGWMK